MSSVLRRRSAGLSLVEILVTSGILLLMLGLATLSMLGYMRTTRVLMEHSSVDSARQLEFCSRTLRSARIVYSPTDEQLSAGFAPTREAPLVLGMHVDNSRELHKVALAVHSGRLERANLTSTPDQADWKRVGDCQVLQVWLLSASAGDTLRIRLDGPRPPFETSVAWSAER